jgi:hypothetical protein
MMKKIFITIIILGIAEIASYAHEPLYGFGPHVLFKNGWAPHITTNFSGKMFSSEYALGYGITPSWTGIVETGFSNRSGDYAIDFYRLKSKYRFYLNNQPGYSHQAAFITQLTLPARVGDPGALDMAFTGGREGLKFYWFASAGYGIVFADNPIEPGDRFIYNFSLGYRPFKVNYYKPDVVFFVETTGFTYQKSKRNGESIQDSGGSNLAVAPTFFFTYRNLAVRGGIQFGVWENKFISKPDTNFKLTVEFHI